MLIFLQSRYILSATDPYLETSVFPPTTELANIVPLHKKGNLSEKDNYRPVSILPNLSKVFEECIYIQVAQVFNKIFSKHQFG